MYLCVYLTGNKARESPVDPASDGYHGEDIGDIALQHLRHNTWVGHGLGGGGALSSGQVTWGEGGVGRILVLD